MAKNSSFTQSLFNNIRRVEKEVNDRCYKITMELFEAIVRRTPSPINNAPYATGLLVNQWYPKTGAGFSEELTSSESDNGSASLARIKALRGGIAFYLRDGRITMSNNVPYAFRAEFRGWPKSDNENWKNAAPYRMVALSLQEIAARYK